MSRECARYFSRMAVKNSEVKPNYQGRGVTEKGYGPLRGKRQDLVDKTYLRGFVLIESENLLGLPGYQFTEVREVARGNRIRAVFHRRGFRARTAIGRNLRTKDKRLRQLRHENWGERRTVLELESRSSIA